MKCIKSVAPRLILKNDRIEAHFDLRRGCRLAALKIPGQRGSFLSQQSQILVSGTARTDLTRNATVVSVRTRPMRDPHMGPGQSATLRIRLELDGAPLEIVRRVDLPDGAGAFRILDVWKTQRPIAGVWYSALGQFDIHGEAARPVIYDWFSCSDQSNHRLITRRGVSRAKGVLTTTGTGLFFWKEGPTPDSRPVKGDWDFDYRNGALTVTGVGFDRAGPDGERRCDGLVIGLVEDETHLTGLRRWQRTRYYRKDLAATTEWIANSWPAFHLNVNEEKIRNEIAAAVESGVDVVTVDDGWFETFMGEVDREKFPGGLEKLAADALAVGVQLGLWMNPLGMDVRDPRAKLWDGAECHDIRLETKEWNWVARTDDFFPCETYISEGVRGYYSMDLCHPGYADYMRTRLAALARAGLRRFKFDLYQLNAYSGMTGDAHAHYEAYRRFLDDLKKLGILVEMDITRRNRPCFDFGLDYGRLFLENRGRNLRDHRWYEPWISLANLWEAARLAPAQLLELEIFPQLTEYPMDYVLSTALVANPLYFGSLSQDMSSDQRREMRRFIDATREVRAALLGGMIVPVGPRPAKHNWSGFASIPVKEGTGYLIAYRNGPEAPEQFRFDLSSVFQGAHSVTVRAGSRNASAKRSGAKIQVRIPDAPGFVVIALESAAKM